MENKHTLRNLNTFRFFWHSGTQLVTGLYISAHAADSAVIVHTFNTNNDMNNDMNTVLINAHLELGSLCRQGWECARVLICTVARWGFEVAHF